MHANASDESLFVNYSHALPYEQPTEDNEHTREHMEVERDRERDVQDISIKTNWSTSGYNTYSLGPTGNMRANE